MIWYLTQRILKKYIRRNKVLDLFAEGRIQRQISSDSMSSINSMSSACSFTSQQSAATDGDLAKKKKKKGWVGSNGLKKHSADYDRHSADVNKCSADMNKHFAY